MSFFDDDPFDDIVKEFFGQEVGRRPKRNQEYEEIIEGEDDERNIDFLESEDYVFFVFELPGYSKEDVNVDVNKNKIEIVAKKNNAENVQTYLIPKLRQGKFIKKILPKSINYKKINHTVKNGILEVVFEKK
ncbi:MAG: Hsp20/alpha crystallin family protein [Nanoarchaeota archaeon]